MYHSATWAANHMAPTFISLVELILKLYQGAGFQVMEVCANHEFKQVLHLQDGGRFFMTNLANALEHVPEAENNNHVL